jgi:hypothetical protein
MTECEGERMFIESTIEVALLVATGDTRQLMRVMVV